MLELGFNCNSFCRCFNWEWISRRMLRGRKQCGKDSTSLPPIRFSPCALTSEVSSSRSSSILQFSCFVVLQLCVLVPLVYMQLGFCYVMSFILFGFVSLLLLILVIQLLLFPWDCFAHRVSFYVIYCYCYKI